MYVCVCNAVTEEAVHTCLASGAQNTRQVKDGCGMKPGCGTCTKRIRAMLSEWKTANELLDAMTGGPATLHSVPDDDSVPAEAPAADLVPAEEALPAETVTRPELPAAPARRFGRPVREVRNPAA
ncbi:bacterioferritin-associated ferredoxin [Actinocorallia herbida]|uniref:Bacterioferritin-associated ferredoxin n=1 Tax=Actinocorallia herbida TaxID=58109 RepID=A0A3N1D968_9ACTN|nr:(2Fe-2S)-binding protein [Actinocorallia herbida]ROO90083.1 bacterioferritin-associated ferredoxin [Actinocorallia herbida]